MFLNCFFFFIARKKLFNKIRKCFRPTEFKKKRLCKYLPKYIQNPPSGIFQKVPPRMPPKFHLRNLSGIFPKISYEIEQIPLELTRNFARDQLRNNFNYFEIVPWISPENLQGDPSG